jgi:hydrogenase-4 component B
VAYLFACLGLLLVGGMTALLLSSRPSLAMKIGSCSAIIGTSALLLTLLLLLRKMGFAASPWEETLLFTRGIRFAYDLASLLFLLPTALLGLIAAIHSIGYLRGHDTKRSGFYWFFYNLTLVAMLMVPLLRSAPLFLIMWELMGVASFVLVIFDWDSADSRRAGWIYLLASHAGGAFLIMMFVTNSRPLSPGMHWLPVVLGIIGFGLKAGFPLLHVWMPSTYPAAPAPVSAIMSGAMSKLGLYGILRFILLPGGDAMLQCGWLLALLGLVGALLGIIMALSQRNIKALVAYSSIENMGIMAMAYGLGVLGVVYKMPGMAMLGFSGALLHMFNHATLKGALFLGAGSVYRATGTLNMEKLGGLMKRMPWTGGTFAANALALGGLPPGNAFLSEFLIYAAAFNGVINGHGPLRTLSLLCILTLALIGGLAIATYSKVISAVFLGEPRSDCAKNAREVSWAMCGSTLALLLINLLLLGLAPYIVPMFAPLLTRLIGGTSTVITVTDIALLLTMPSIFSLLLIGLSAAAIRWRQWLGERRQDAEGVTWDCGFAAPTARMEYTGTAFAQPLLDAFAGVLGLRRQIQRPETLFPDKIRADLHSQDLALSGVWRPLFRRFSGLAIRTHRMQSGFLHAYILTMVLALVVMLVWGMFCHRLDGPTTAAPVVTEEISK